MNDRPDAATSFHLSLHVRDLHASTGFYRDLFALEPAEERADYARFVLSDPPLVLALVPCAERLPAETRLGHLGLRVAAPADLEAALERLRDLGYEAVEERGVECCYAMQDKFWVRDPDGNPWEVYRRLDGGAGSAVQRGECVVCDAEAPVEARDGGCC